MRYRKAITIALIFFAAGFFAKNIFFGDKKEPGPADTGEAGVTTKEEVKQFSISGFSEDGKKAWQVEGKSADIFADVINISKINADSYSDKANVNLKAEEGVFDKRTSDVELNNNVVIITDEGTKLTTEALEWNASKECVTTDNRVFIERKDVDIEGDGAWATPNLKRAKLLKNIKLTVKDPKSAVITCDGPFEIDYAGYVAYFFNNVKLDDKEAVINTDKATAYLDPDKKALKKVLCQGSVKIVREGNTTYAEELTYLPEEGRVILSGRPKIVVSDVNKLAEQAKEKDEPAQSKKPD